MTELRKRHRMDPNVLTGIKGVSAEDRFVSVLVLGEIREEIEQIRRKDRARAEAFERWLQDLETDYGGHIPSISPMVADQWGRFSSIRPLSVIDGLLAATACVHNLTLVTRNIDHVAHTGVNLLNPFPSG